MGRRAFLNRWPSSSYVGICTCKPRCKLNNLPSNKAESGIHKISSRLLSSPPCDGCPTWTSRNAQLPQPQGLFRPHEPCKHNESREKKRGAHPPTLPTCFRQAALKIGGRRRPSWGPWREFRGLGGLACTNGFTRERDGNWSRSVKKYG